MAFKSVTSSYTGDALKKYILQALIGGETLSTNGISVLTGVKYKRHLKKLTSSNIVQSHSCDFNPSSGVTISEGVLEPQKIKINEKICFDEVYELWDAADMADGTNSEQFPQELADALTEEYINQAAKEVEEAVWQGDEDGSTGGIKDLFDGYELILSEGHTANCSGNTLTATGLTVDNIVTELNKVYAALPSAVKKKPKGDLVIFLSHEALALYEMNLATQGMNTSVQGGNPTLYGIELKPVGGLSSDNNIVMGERANFYIGTDLVSDFNELKMIDQRDITMEDAVRFGMKAKIDVSIAYPCEAIFYKE